MKIEFHTPINDEDRAYLLQLLGDAPAAPAEKPIAKKAAAPKKDEPVDAEIVPDPEPEEDLMEQAVQKATKMVSDGNAAAVKAALGKVGARRVSELKDDEDIRKFLKALG